MLRIKEDSCDNCNNEIPTNVCPACSIIADKSRFS